MKNFNYTARDHSGATQRGSVKALDRNAALKELAAQGLVPLSVTEGAAQPGGARFKPAYLITAGIAVLILAVWLGMNYLAKSTPQKKTPVKREKVQTSPKKEVALQVKPVVTNVVVHPLKVEPLKVETLQPAPPEPVSTNSLEYHIARKEGRIDEEGKIIPKPRAYKSGTEQVLNMIMNKQLGDVPSPLPILHPSERTNLVAILNSDIMVYDQDTERSLQQKANVAQAKRLMKDYMAQGGTPEEFLRFFRDELTKAHKEWLATQKELMALSKTDPESALKYAEEQNKLLSEKGIKPLILPIGLDVKNP